MIQLHITVPFVVYPSTYYKLQTQRLRHKEGDTDTRDGCRERQTSNRLRLRRRETQRETRETHI